MAFCSNTGAYFDGTLWFIKVLLLLYLAFFVSTCMKNKTKRLIALAILTVGVAIFVSYFMKTWMAISVPLFMVGACVADCQDFFQESFLCVLCIIPFIVRVGNLCILPAFNHTCCYQLFSHLGVDYSCLFL